MNLVKWDPFSELEEVSSRLNRIFGRPAEREEIDRELLKGADWTPPADISETESVYLIRADLPGVSKNDVKVSVQDGMLSIQGERRRNEEEKGRKFHRVECSYGSFARSFRMPADTDESSVKAEFKEGVLSITLSKSEKARHKAVSISVS